MIGAQLKRHLRDCLRGGSGAVLGIGGILFIWLALLFNLHLANQAALSAAQNETTNLAHAFEAQITREIKAVDQSLMFVRQSYARDPGRFDVAEWARSAAAVTDTAIQLTIVDRDGIMRANSATPTATPISLADREHIRVHMRSAQDELFISKPVIGRVSQRWSVQFTRKLFDQNGAFAGVAVVSLDPTYLTRLYAAIDLGKTGAVTLFGTDGVIRAAIRDNGRSGSELIGKDVAGAAAPLGDARSEAFVGPTDLDGVRRVTSYKRLDAYPLIVAAGLGGSEVLGKLGLMRDTDLLLAIVLTVILAVATVAMSLHQRQHAIARERLRHSERRYAEKSMILETALEHMDQGILMVDGNRRVQVCNRRTATMLALPGHLTTKGTPFDDIIQHQWRAGEFGDGSVLTDEVRAFIRSGGICNDPQTYERRRPSGETLEIRSLPLADGGVVRTYTDISVRKAFEEDLQAARDQASLAATAKSDFLAMISYEIRSPLSGLVGALDLLRGTPLQPDQVHLAGLAHGSALNLLAILNDILDFSKIEAGALTLSVEAVDIRLLVTEQVQPHQLVARAHSVTLEATVAPDIPAYIRTDRLRLGQIITNLLSNAVKFTRHGTIALSARMEQANGAPTLRIDVVDTGCGMDDRTLQNLFQPFTQADNSNSRAAGGTGLGLSISRKLAAFLDGTLDVESTPGIGSRFILRIRCIAAQPERPAITDPAAIALDRVLAGRTILVVDDNPTNQWLTRRQLTLLGATVETVSSGASALEALARSRFDTVVTDCHMPGMDGASLTRAIRRGSGPERTRPVIGLTADVTPEQANRCRAAGMTELLYKPVDLSRLAQVLAQFLGPTAVPPPASDEAAIFDSSTCRELFEPGDPEAADWLRSYGAHAQAKLDALVALANAAPLDRHALAEAAHQLVGASLCVGVVRFAHALRALEQAAADQPADALIRLAAAAAGQHRVAATAIDEFLAMSQPALA